MMQYIEMKYGYQMQYRHGASPDSFGSLSSNSTLAPFGFHYGALHMGNMDFKFSAVAMDIALEINAKWHRTRMFEGTAMEFASAGTIDNQSRV